MGVSLGSAALHTAGYSLGAALVATAMALPVALLRVRHPGRAAPAARADDVPRSRHARARRRARDLVLLQRTTRTGFGYQTAPLLVLAYAIMFFPLALVCVRASVAQSPVSLEEVAGSLGVAPACLRSCG